MHNYSVLGSWDVYVNPQNNWCLPQTKGASALSISVPCVSVPTPPPCPQVGLWLNLLPMEHFRIRPFVSSGMVSLPFKMHCFLSFCFSRGFWFVAALWVLGKPQLMWLCSAPRFGPFHVCFTLPLSVGRLDADILNWPFKESGIIVLISLEMS